MTASASTAGRFLLLVNPSAGGGRARELLPRGRGRTARPPGSSYRTVMTTGLEHGCEEALAAAAAGEVPVVMSGDGLIGAGRRRARRLRRRRSAIIPGGRGNDFARVLGIPDRARRRRSRCSPPGAARRIDVGEANGKRFLGIASCGFDSDANRIANETQLIARQPRLRLRRAARADRLEAGPLHDHASTASARAFTGYSVAAANTKAYGGGMFIAPDAELDDGLLDVVTTGDVGKLRFLANLPKVFKGTHVENARGRASRARAEVRDRGRPAVRRLRRRRPRSPTCRRPSACCRGALRVIVPA